MTSEDILLWAIECWSKQEDLEILEVEIKKPVPCLEEQTHNETNTII